jgi:hypothetical protein
MDLYRQVYERLDALPKQERIELLMEILPPQELFARTDGFRCLIHAYGLRIFETSAMLKDAGIPEDDPRTAVFSELRGGLIDRQIANKLRAIAAREVTICRRAGGLQIWEGGRLGWWVPLPAASRFEAAVRELIGTFAQVRDRLLIDDYVGICAGAMGRWQEASLAAYLNLRRLGHDLKREAFLERSLGVFKARFPTQDEVRRKIRMELEPLERPLPERIEKILLDVRQAEVQAQQAQAEQAREQKRLVAIERDLREAELRRLDDERLARDRILREAIDPQIRQAQEVIVQVQSSLLRLAHEITQMVRGGGSVSPATRRSWTRRLKSLSLLATGNVAMEEALQDLKQLARDRASANAGDVSTANRNVQRALAELERRASIEINADQIWQLMQHGKGEAALRQVASLRGRLQEELTEVEALWDMVVDIGARNEMAALPAMGPAR